MSEKRSILKIFISSTYRDLKEVRGLLIQGLEEALEAVAMEKFLPGDGSSHEKSIEFLEGSDACIFIIGDYYGTVINDCRIRTGKCGDCNGSISYTHCEYRRALQANKPHVVYIVESGISDVLSNVERFDLEETREIDLIRFLERNKIDISKINLLNGYTLEQIKELWRIARDENREKLKHFKEEISPELHARVTISQKEEYYTFQNRILQDLKKKIIEWYKEKRINFTDFAGRRKKLPELIKKLNEENSVCVWGLGGIGKTALIQLALLLERLSGRKIYALYKDYRYTYTKTGYSPAKKKFDEEKFTRKLTLDEIVNLVLGNYGKSNMEKNKKESALMRELNREGSILFIDDLHDADKDVEEFIFRCGNSLNDGAVVAGTRQKGNFYSIVGPLAGLKGTDLKEMILNLAENYSTKEHIRDDLDDWIESVFRSTDGHPILVDSIVKNAHVFLDCKKLDEIRTTNGIMNREALAEVTRRIVSYILTEKELEFIRYLSKFTDPINESVYKGNEDILHGLIEKGFLHWREGKLSFIFSILRELIETDAVNDSYPNP